ncbi:hypothetical protein BH24CHL4_BH24CHL4_21430 [soil metagenome]
MENSANTDIHRRRREILFAVCCAESYIYEWTIDTLGSSSEGWRLRAEIDEYFDLEPKGRRFPSLIEQWKDIPKRLCEAMVTSGREDSLG